MATYPNKTQADPAESEHEWQKTWEEETARDLERQSTPTTPTKEHTTSLVPASRDRTFTKLIDKHASPLTLRKITKYGFPIYVAIITDDDLSDFDDVLFGFMEKNKADGWVNNIQKLRNLTGAMSEVLCATYPKTEGVAIVIYADKCLISSLFGDFMNHNGCRVELMGYLNLIAHI